MHKKLYLTSWRRTRYRLNLSILSTNNTVLLDKELILKLCKKKLFEIIINDYIDESLFKDNHYKVIIK